MTMSILGQQRRCSFLFKGYEPETILTFSFIS
jgi:hypothetical protein